MHHFQCILLSIDIYLAYSTRWNYEKGIAIFFCFRDQTEKGRNWSKGEIEGKSPFDKILANFKSILYVQ